MCYILFFIIRFCIPVQFKVRQFKLQNLEIEEAETLIITINRIFTFL